MKFDNAEIENCEHDPPTIRKMMTISASLRMRGDLFPTHNKFKNFSFPQTGWAVIINLDSHEVNGSKSKKGQMILSEALALASGERYPVEKG